MKKKKTRIKKISVPTITVEWHDLDHVSFHVTQGKESYSIKAYDVGDVHGQPALWVTNSGREIGPDLMDVLDRSPGYTEYVAPAVDVSENKDTPVRIEFDTVTGECKTIESRLPFASEVTRNTFNGEGNLSYSESIDE